MKYIHYYYIHSCYIVDSNRLVCFQCNPNMSMIPLPPSKADCLSLAGRFCGNLPDIGNRLTCVDAA